MLWVDKYRPKSTHDIIHNNTPLDILKTWLSDFKLPKTPKAALLWGSPGIGKTSTVYALANTLGYHVIELNASDIRNKDSLLNAIETITKTPTQSITSFFSHTACPKKQLILMEEIDGMAEGDHGGIAALISIISRNSQRIKLQNTAQNPSEIVTKQTTARKTLEKPGELCIKMYGKGNPKPKPPRDTQIPIICTCNDFYHKKIKKLKPYVQSIAFEPIPINTIILTLWKILCQEKIINKKNTDACKKRVVDIANTCNGDLRSAINTTQFAFTPTRKSTLESALGANSSTNISGATDIVAIKERPIGLFVDEISPSDSWKWLSQCTIANLDMVTPYLHPFALDWIHMQYLHAHPSPTLGAPYLNTWRHITDAADAFSQGDLFTYVQPRYAEILQFKAPDMAFGGRTSICTGQGCIPGGFHARLTNQYKVPDTFKWYSRGLAIQRILHTINTNVVTRRINKTTYNHPVYIPPTDASLFAGIMVGRRVNGEDEDGDDEEVNPMEAYGYPEEENKWADIQADLDKLCINTSTSTAVSTKNTRKK